MWPAALPARGYPRHANWKFAPLRVTNLEIRHESFLSEIYSGVPL